MAKITGGLLSLNATGTIADTLTFAKTRGVAYARQRVVPSNPNSTGQQTTRNTFSWTSGVWKNAGSLLRAPWDAYASGQPFNERNAFMGQNLAALRGLGDLSAFIGSPGARGGLPASSIALTAGSEQITVDFTNPAAPTGWTLVSAIAVAIADQDPENAADYVTVAGEDDTSQAQVVLTNLTASQLYYVAAWLEWQKPDGTTAYGASILDSDTPNA